MANVVITLKVMPSSPEIDLTKLKDIIKEKIISFSGIDEIRIKEEPIAFGLKALIFMFLSPEEKGDTEPLEKEIETIEGVESVTITDVRRAVG